MSFQRECLPDTMTYFECEGLKLTGRGKWRTAGCAFHGGSDSMRINLSTGAWVCMACGVSGGDVLAYHMQAHGIDFRQAAKALGCWVDDGRPQRPQKPAPLSPRAALQVLAFEATLVAVGAGNVARGVVLTKADRSRLLKAAGRINRLVEAFS